jgi:hypothetical protein
MQDNICEEPSIPSRLKKGDRITFNKFRSDEKLYRWFPPYIKYESNGKLSASTVDKAFSPPYDISCNRSFMCVYSTDVLYNVTTFNHRIDFGVIEGIFKSINNYSFSLDFRRNSKISETVNFRFEVEHDPHPCMYPHTVINIFKNGEKIENSNQKEINSKQLKTAIRDHLSDLFRVVHEPDPNFVLPNSSVKIFFKSIENWIALNYLKIRK